MIGGTEIDMACADKLASFLLYALIVDFSLEMLDFTHRLYEAEVTKLESEVMECDGYGRLSEALGPLGDTCRVGRGEKTE